MLILQKQNYDDRGEGLEVENDKETEKQKDTPEEAFLNYFPGVRPLYTHNKEQQK